jgi:hypothetical protein
LRLDLLSARNPIVCKKEDVAAKKIRGYQCAHGEKSCSRTEVMPGFTQLPNCPYENNESTKYKNHKQDTYNYPWRFPIAITPIVRDRIERGEAKATY